MHIYKSITLVLFLFISTKVYAQHDPGRNAVRLLAIGKTAEAVKLVAKPPHLKYESPISDADRYLVLAMASCQKGDVAEAFSFAQKAVAKGLPLERLQAGPREVLEPLYANSKYKEWIKTRQKKLLHGPLLGAVSDSSASFWVRTAGENDVVIQVKSLSVQNGKIMLVEGSTSSKTDYTATIKISGLSPNRKYGYRVMVDGRETGPWFEFSTASRQGKGSRFSIVFGGGSGFTPQYERMWTTIGKHKPDALVLLGDNVYIDDPEHLMTQHYCYFRRQSQPEWRKLVASTSVYSIYDDHDFGINDCDPGPDTENPKWKRKVWETFTHNWNNPAYGGGEKQPGCWYDYYIGDVHFIMLDGRYYRDQQGGSMLGSVQKKWLFKTLKSSKGKIKVLTSPVPWSPGVKPGSKDTWDGFSAEREEIFSFIETNKIDGLLLMSADRHRTDLRKIKRPNGYDLYEMMSSRLTNVHTHGLMKKAKGSEFIMGYNKKCSFGLVEFDTISGDPEIKYSMLSIDDEMIDSRTLKLSQMKHSKKQ